MNISFEISPDIDNNGLNKLFEDSWPNYSKRNFAYLDKSLFFICCYDEAKKLVGFVNVIGDGFLHGVLLDVTVTPKYRNLGIGSKLVNLAIQEAKKRGLEWIHVDYEPYLEKFYFNCGFNKTKAGIINLKAGP